MLTAKIIATKLNIDISTVSKWLNGKHKPMKKEIGNIESKFPGLIKILTPPISAGDSYNNWLIMHRAYTDVQCKCKTCGDIRILDILELYTGEICINCGSYTPIEKSLLSTEKTYTPKIESIIKQKLHQCWVHMIRRCSPEAKDTELKNYYNSGVRVCKEWQDKEGEENFTNWALKSGYRPGLQIDKDFKGDGKLYSPDTCCFVTRSINNARRRKSIQTNDIVPYIGVSIAGKKFFAQVVQNNKRIFGKTFKTAKEAAIARNNFIIENNLPHSTNKIE